MSLRFDGREIEPGGKYLRRCAGAAVRSCPREDDHTAADGEGTTQSGSHMFHGIPAECICFSPLADRDHQRLGAWRFRLETAGHDSSPVTGGGGADAVTGVPAGTVHPQARRAASTAPGSRTGGGPAGRCAQPLLFTG